MKPANLTALSPPSVRLTHVSLFLNLDTYIAVTASQSTQVSYHQLGDANKVAGTRAE